MVSELTNLFESGICEFQHLGTKGYLKKFAYSVF